MIDYIVGEGWRDIVIATLLTDLMAVLFIWAMLGLADALAAAKLILILEAVKLVALQVWRDIRSRQ